MSAEERLDPEAALALALAETEGEWRGTGSAAWMAKVVWPVMEARLAAGVRVPTEPGAPKGEPMTESAALPFPTTDAREWASEFVRLHGGDASRPVPAPEPSALPCICTPDQFQGHGHGVNCPQYAPEPSARLREAVAAWWASFRPLGWTEDEHLSYPTVNIPVHEQPLARAYVESRAATPQDPEETR